MSVLSSIFVSIKRIITKRYFYSAKRDKKIWLFGEWFGNNCCDNSMFLANYVCEQIPDVLVVWATKKNTDLSHLDSRAKVVYFNSEEAIQIYRKAGVVFFNQNYKDFSEEGQNYFAGAITVNLWHGAQWKKIGFDASKKKGFIHEIRIFLDKINDDAEIYIALSEPYAKCLMSAYRIKKDKLFYTGYPRNDILYLKSEIEKDRKLLIDLLKSQGYTFPDNPYFVLYMPTFRDSVDDVFDISHLDDDKQFSDWLDEKNVFVIYKSHLAMKSDLRFEHDNNRIIHFNSMISQELLAAADMLITDYSSCFFDYLIKDAPIIHFIYDYDFYRDKDRGLYYNYEDVVCGDVAWNIADLRNAIKVNYDNRTNELRTLRFKKFMTYEVPDSCSSISNEILNRITKVNK